MDLLRRVEEEDDAAKIGVASAIARFGGLDDSNSVRASAMGGVNHPVYSLFDG